MIKVLVVEDNEAKRLRVRKTILDALGESRCELEEVTCFVDACERLENNQVDLLVLDLLIPRERGGVSEDGLATSLFRSLCGKGPRLKTPRFIFGLTAYDAAKDSLQAEFSGHGWTITKYDESSTVWSDTLSRVLEHVHKVTPDVDQSPKHVVMVVHGIRDFGSWQSTVKRLLEADASLTAVTLKYGRFSLLRFVASTRLLDFGKKPLKRVAEEYANIRSQYPNAKVSVIAHSFGTHLITRLMLCDPHVKFFRIVLCGSVVKQDFNWSLVQSRIGDDDNPRKSEYIINDCGNADFWPVFAKSLGYGAIGTNGAGSASVYDRFHDGGHGLFMDSVFIEKYWIPFMKSGEVVKSEVESRKNLPKFTIVIDVVPVWLIMFLLAAAIYLFFSPP
ncbi:hypothetical protein [Fuerstiella marisgermanici]|nr:hypothetical protein [Fuerstiella marisgermanici]